MGRSVYDVRDWGTARPRLPRSARQIRAARNLSVEQAARLVPEWGHMEVRYRGDTSSWGIRSL